MKLFMASSPGGSIWEGGSVHPAPLDNRNGFVERLLAVCPEGAGCLILSSDPKNFGMNDDMRNIFTCAFEQSGISVSRVDICDDRNRETAMSHLDQYQMLILAGGHVPTENAFYQELGLRDRLKYYDGVIIGVSAGTMNCADVVYASPEEEGEAVDPDYQRYLPGLGLTEINVLPHFQMLRNVMLDGLRLVEDICLPDSRVRPFYALPDGSYLYKENGKTVLYGEAWLFRDGSCVKVCETGASLEVPDER